jgi:hypothetical protein
MRESYAPDLRELGTVYLLHFDRPYVAGAHAPCRHYIGWTRSLGARLQHHAKGSGVRFLSFVHARGIRWTVAREWDGDRTLECRLKYGKYAA